MIPVTEILHHGLNLEQFPALAGKVKGQLALNVGVTQEAFSGFEAFADLLDFTEDGWDLTVQ